MVCGTGVLGLWGVGFGVEVSGTALGMGNGIVGVSEESAISQGNST